MKSVAGSAESWKDTGLSSNTNYWYRIQAVDSDFDVSAFASTAAIKTNDVAGARPVVKIQSFHSGSDPLQLSENLSISGIVDDANNDLTAWKLVLRPATGSATGDLLVAAGTSEIGEAPGVHDGLGTIQPSLLPNGLYRLYLIASDAVGTSEASSSLIHIDTEAKVGNFVLPVVDLSIDVPGASPIVARRVYDSSKANSAGDFGFGWDLDLAETNLRTTAQPGQYGGSDHPAFRGNDMVYIDIPGKGTQAFMFRPTPLNYQPGNPGMGYVQGIVPYKPQFVAMDGSNSTLEVESTNGQSFTLKYSAEGFYSEDIGSGQLGFSPTRREFGNQYQLSTEDGTVYKIRASTGKLISSTDAHGNVTNYEGNTITAGSERLYVERDGSNRISSIARLRAGQLPENAKYKLLYHYNTAGELDSVEEVANDKRRTLYTFEYDDKHLLISVIDSRGIRSAAVTYDANGRVIQVTDATGKSAPISTGGASGTSGLTRVTDLAGNVTETLYNRRGDVIREIKHLGNDRYQITAREYIYFENPDNQHFDPLQYGVSAYNKPITVTEWKPYVITDTVGERYSTATPSGQYARQVIYKINPAGADPRQDPDLFMPEKERVYDINGQIRETRYSKYVLGRPQRVEQAIVNPTTEAAKTLSVAWAKYDAKGNLLYQIDGLGNGTEYTYDANGQVRDTWRIYIAPTTGTEPPTEKTRLKLLSTNHYTDKRLVSTQTFSPNGEVVTTYIYDAEDALRL